MVIDKSIAEQFTNLMKEIESKIKSDVLKQKQEQQWIEKKKSIFKEKLTTLLKKEKINPNIFSLSIEDKETEDSEIEEIRKSIMNPSETLMQCNPINQFALTGSIRAWILLYLYYTKLYKGGQVVLEGRTIGDIKDKVAVVGSSGGGAGAGAVKTLQDTIVRSYLFTPLQSGNYWFRVDIPYHGYYIVRAFDGAWDSAFATVKIDGDIYLNQYYTHPITNYNHLWIHQQNINLPGRMETTRTEYYNTALGGGDPCWLFVIQRLFCDAQGTSSYAEINFEQGTSNYLPPPHVTAFREY
jgi:flagellar biosynthesis/type III secretory pathway chaperone